MALRVLVEARVSQSLETRHESAHAGHRQTTLPAIFSVIVEKVDPRIDQDGLGYWLGIGISRIVHEAEDHDPQGHADLRGRDARAAVSLHGIPHVAEELIQLGRRNITHRLRHLQQAGIAHSKYFANCHGS